MLYPSGASASMDYAVRRAVLTSINQTAGTIMSMRANELDHDLMETTAHYGAREEHAWWQGRVVSRSGQEGYLTLFDVGYGTVTGIFGANCRHNWFMHFGFRTYTDAQLEDMKNKTVTYNGQEMPYYDATQKQRAMERSVKSSKRELVALDEAMKNLPEDKQLDLKLQFQNRSVRLKQQEARLSDFCKQTGMKRDRFREQVFSTDTENGIKRWTKSTSAKAVWGKRKALTNSTARGIIKQKRGVEMHIDKFTPCLEDAKTGEIISTSFSLASKRELVRLNGWKFNWNDSSLDTSEIYKLTIKGDDIIQGLISISKRDGDKAMYINIVESAPHNIGTAKKYNGVGGHLYAIAAQKSVEAGYGGFLFMDAKNMELVEHYEKTLGAVLLGRPHPYRMFIDEETAHKLLEIYTLEGE